MLTGVLVYNEFGNELSLPMDNSGKFIVKEIDGLGPVPAQIASSQYVGMDGGVVTGSRGGMRNIVLHLGYNQYDLAASSQPVTALRRDLYRHFTPQMPVTLHFISDDYETVKISGIVESMEPAIFTKEPEVQISILCARPHFSSMAQIEIKRNGPGLVELPYSGTVPTGFILTMRNISSSIPSFRVTQFGSTVNRLFYAGSLYSQGDALHFQINTIKGQRSAYRMITSEDPPGDLPAFTSANSVNVLGFVDQWLEVAPGKTLLNVSFFETESFRVPRISLRYTPLHAGL